MTEDETLDRVIALWAEADKHSDEAERLLGEVANEEKMSDDKEHEAEEMWKPLAAAHPEWFDDLLSGIDPRTVDHDTDPDTEAVAWHDLPPKVEP